jgi:hypothetical protein
VNTLASSDRDNEFIRVFIDPMYWHSVGTVPDSFEGYRVTVERRNPTVAQALPQSYAAPCRRLRRPL